MNTKKQAFYHKPYYPWLVWGIAAFFFFCEYFARVSPGVMGPYLMRDLAITGFGLGSLSIFFYYPYLAMQVPVGLLVDRFGVRKLLTLMAFLTGAACVIFGCAKTIHIAQVGRFLIGFSAAFAFVSALKLAAEWFPPQRLGLLAGMTQAMGMLGASVGEAPVSLLVSEIGWRHTMFAMAAVFVILGLLIGAIVRDNVNSHHKTEIKSEDVKGLWHSLMIVMSNRQTWMNALYAGLVYAPSAAFAELWGPRYLTDARHLSAHVAAGAVMMIFVAWGIGGPLFGWLTDRIGKRKPLMYFSALAGALTMATLFFTPNLSAAMIYTLLFLYGLTNCGVAIAYAVSTEINPAPVAGTSLAFTNMLSVIIGAALQPVIGHVLDSFTAVQLVNNVPVYSTTAFQTALVALPICSGLGILAALFVRETNCRRCD